jgi:exodeoxyribonuclease V alpha subunit
MNAAIPDRRPATEEISGVIERVTFHNDDSGFCVLRVKTKGHREETTVVGSLPSVTAGEWLVAEGGWVRDREHGLQFKATTMKTVPPTTAEGIERYLGSGLVKSIGPILAKKLVLRFEAEVLAVIENRAAELQSVNGIGPKCRERIAHAWQEAKSRCLNVPFVSGWNLHWSAQFLHDQRGKLFGCFLSKVNVHDMLV